MPALRAFVLNNHRPGLYTFLESYEVDTSDQEPLERLKQTVPDYIKSLPRFSRCKSLDVSEPEIYLVRWTCGTQTVRHLTSSFTVFDGAPGAATDDEEESC
jgi:hypothetical protein